MTADFDPSDVRAVQALLEDELWLLCNVTWIKPKSGAVGKFIIRPEQLQLYRDMWFRNVILKARQLGFSTMICLLIFLRCIRNADFTAAIVDNKIDDGKKKIAIIRRAWEHLDDPRDEACSSIGALIKSTVRLVTDSKTELAWSNGSSVYTAMSVRGGSLQFLHLSELGRTSVMAPAKAEEIMAGGVPTVSDDCLIVSESTHEGGPFGVHYSLVKQAMGRAGKSLSPLDWDFHWFSWHTCKDYRMSTGEIEGALTGYFKELADIGITLDDDQKRWYSAQYRTLKHRVKTEYPSNPDEALSAISQGSIYGDIISLLRLNKRVSDFVPETTVPAFVFWDIGDSDTTVMWLVQFVGREILWLDWHEDNGRTPAYFSARVRKWEDDLGISVATNFLPHDANSKHAGLTWCDHLRKAGLHRITVVPITPDVWSGVNVLRGLLPRSRFHTRCDTVRTKDGVEYPSGLACLELYRKDVEIDSGRMKEKPVHDFTSHSSDAARTLAEAWERGMVQSMLYTGEAKDKKRDTRPAVVMGFAGQGGRETESDFWKEFDK